MIKQLTLSALLFCIAQLCFAQSTITGTWKTIDDQTGEAKSYITIEERDGKYYGTISEILREGRRDALCTECDGSLKDQPILGMTILNALEPYKDYYSYGTILDPENGKIYKCSLWQEDENTLTVRGYIGISALGRSQNWSRVKK
jgi:uncharacterized protein (DUF2147 family)